MNESGRTTSSKSCCINDLTTMAHVGHKVALMGH